MEKEIKNIAIYARKSVYRETSESTKAQIKMCSDSCMANFAGCKLFEYEDEGFTGANTHRPGFAAMMEDVKSGLIDMVFCYKLDRISRNIKDFVNFYSELQEYNVEFGCLKDLIDTTTPAGRLMMYVIAAFSESERENIAERVKDSMLQLVKLGYWTGGKPPIGYKIEKVTVAGKKHSNLVQDEESKNFLFYLQDLFLSGLTLSSIEKKFKEDGTRTINGNFFSTIVIWSYLKSPFCCVADKHAFDYFKSLGCKMETVRELWDGSKGVMVYGRNKKGKKQEPNNWTVCIGNHVGICPSERWIAIQNRFGVNKFDKKKKSEYGILRGVLRCKCGSLMSINAKQTKSKKNIYYRCSKRARRGIEYCDMEHIKVDLLDNAFIDVFKAIEADRNVISQFRSEEKSKSRTEKEINADISKYTRKIENLTDAISNDSSSAKYLIKQIEELDRKIDICRVELIELEKEKERTKHNEESDNDIYKKACYWIKNFDNLEYSEKNAIVHEVVKECTWDGEELHIKF